MKTIKYYLLVVLCILATSVQGQTLRAIVFCNTIDESIGQSMQVELNNVLNQIQSLNALLDYDFQLEILDGPKCTRANLKRIIDEMEVYPEDVVLTFYGGHGSHAENNEDDPWPQYCMNSGFENQGNWVPMAELEKWIAAKNPRLRIILSNCCNKEQSGTTIKPLWADGGRSTSLNGLNANHYKKLFSVSGCVMSTSSKLGQYSWCNMYGGIYTNDFWTVMNMVGKGQVTPDWESVLDKVYEICSSREIRTNEYPYKAVQNPYHKVKLGKPKVDDGKDDNGGDKPRIEPKNINPLARALERLVDKRISQDRRLDMIPEILQQFFGYGSKVMTYGNDMKTAVELEDASVFLRRICLSPYIRQINIIKESSDLLEVHEVR